MGPINYKCPPNPNPNANHIPKTIPNFNLTKYVR